MIDPTKIRQIGRYEVVRFIAEGGFSWVFEVTDPDFGARRALKMLKPWAATGTDLERFFDEARQLANLNHPHVVQIFDLGRDEETKCPFYTMTLADGPNLGQRIRGLPEDGRLPFRLVMEIFKQVLSGLARIHEFDIVHRDIKPANILLLSDGNALLSDLGIARVGGASGRTKTGVAMGTALYMSPEQARGRPVAPASDIFSMGLCLYHALMGRTVYDSVDELDATSGQEILMYLGSLVHSGQELALEFDESIPEPVQSVIRRACRFIPEERYDNAREMLLSLSAVLEGPLEPSRGVVVEEEEEALDVSRLLAFAAGLALVIGIVAGLWWGLGSLLGSSLEARFEHAVTLHNSLAGLKAELAKRSIPPSEDLLGRAGESLGLAERLLAGGQDDPRAEQSVDLAIGELEELCGALSSEYLDQTVAEENLQVEGLVGQMDSLRVGELREGEWKALHASWAEARAPVETSDPCERTQELAGRLTSLGTVRVAGGTLLGSLRAEWPRLAEAARGEAEKARDQAEAPELESAPFSRALEEARSLFAEADAQNQSGDHLEAVSKYGEAKVAFETASAIAAAASERAVAEGLEQEATSLGELGAAGQKLAAAHALWEEGSWGEARQAYREAAESLDQLIRDGVRSERAREAFAGAEAAKERGAAANATRNSPLKWAEAEAKLDSAQRLFESGSYDEAEKAYGEAEEGFAAAQADANEILTIAASRLGKALAELGEDGCADFQAVPAQEACGDAVAALDEAGSALADGDASRATRRIGFAEVRLVRARRFEETRPRPPVLASRTPSDEGVQARQTDKVTFSVEGTDPAGDKLSYAWTVGGKPAGTGPSLELQVKALELEPKEQARVEVEVRDPGGLGFTEGWNLTIAENRRPKLSVTPREVGPLQVGSSVQFEAKASDPDGDKVEVLYYIGEQFVARGKSYRFKAQDVGSHRVGIRARDSGGGVTELWRTVNVEPAGPAKPPPEVRLEASRSGPLEVDQSRQFTATAIDPEGRDLVVEFLVDGSVEARGTRFAFMRSKPGVYKVAARVTGPGVRELKSMDVEVVASTRKAVPNRAPTLSLRGVLSPLEVGVSRDFEAVAFDPDGDELEIEFRVDGKVEASGQLLTFQRSTVGSYRIEATAVDPDGLSATDGVEVKVVGSPIAAATPPRRPRAGGSGDHGRILVALKEYESALEACDSARLQAVLPQSAFERKIYQKRCDQCGTMFTTVEPRDISVVGTNATADIVLFQECQKTGKVFSTRARATLVDRGGADWSLRDVSPR